MESVKEETSSSMAIGVIVLLSTLTVIVLCVLVCCGYKKWKDKTRMEVCPYTNETFMVQNNKHEPEWVGQEVAKRLSELARKADKLVNYMVEKNIPTPEIAKRLGARWANIRNNPQGLRETAFGETSAAYTVNKSEQIRICIRDPKAKEVFEDSNTAMLVLLHELAHIMSQTYGHNVEFKKNFAYITKVAVDLGLYNYVDYMQNPTSYCSTDITHSPY